MKAQESLRARVLSGATFATLHPEAINVRGAAVNLPSLMRLDSRKRLVAVVISRSA